MAHSDVTVLREQLNPWELKILGKEQDFCKWTILSRNQFLPAWISLD